MGHENISYNDGKTIYSRDFIPVLEFVRIFVAKGENQKFEDVSEDIINDLELGAVFLSEADADVQGNMSSKFDDLVANITNDTSNNGTVFGIPLAGNVLTKKIDRPYPGVIVSFPLESGLSLDYYFGMVNDRVVVAILMQSPIGRLEDVLSSLKVTQREKVVAIESSELEYPEVGTQRVGQNSSSKIWQVKQRTPLQAAGHVRAGHQLFEF